MKSNWKQLITAFLANAIITLVGVMLFFDPISKKDTISGPLAPPLVGFIIYVALSIWLFDWAARQLGNAYKAGFLIGASQFILVNVDFVFRGERGIMTAAASTVLLVVTWLGVAFVYSYFNRNK
mgnify:CR=1 FL=1